MQQSVHMFSSKLLQHVVQDRDVSRCGSRRDWSCHFFHSGQINLLEFMGDVRSCHCQVTLIREVRAIKVHGLLLVAQVLCPGCHITCD
jgi:hypothetical protein